MSRSIEALGDFTLVFPLTRLGYYISFSSFNYLVFIYLFIYFHFNRELAVAQEAEAWWEYLGNE